MNERDRLFHSDEIGSNGLACAMCHPNASNTHPETYPKFQTQLKEVLLCYGTWSTDASSTRWRVMSWITTIRA